MTRAATAATMPPGPDDTCATCGAPLHLCPYDGDHTPDPAIVASDQIAEALVELDRHPDSYIRWPWRDLDALYGGMAPGTVHYVVGFSGLGKSTFIASAMLRWKATGRAVDVMPLEIRPHTFRTYLACLELGVDPGRVLSGDYLRDEHAAVTREDIKSAVLRQSRADFAEHIVVHGVPEVTVRAVERAADSAAARGAELLVIDHIDHIEGDGERRQSLYEASVAVNRAVLRLAQRSGLVVICMSQANQSALAGTTDHLAKYLPLREHHVLNGGHKRQNATGMLSLYRPLAPMPLDAEAREAWKAALKAARSGAEPPHTALEPNTMGVALMKSRNYGGREGRRVSLTWSHGRIVDRDVLPFALRDRGAA